MSWLSRILGRAKVTGPDIIIGTIREERRIAEQQRDLVTLQLARYELLGVEARMLLAQNPPDVLTRCYTLVQKLAFQNTAE